MSGLTTDTVEIISLGPDESTEWRDGNYKTIVARHSGVVLVDELYDSKTLRSSNAYCVRKFKLYNPCAHSAEVVLIARD